MDVVNLFAYRTPHPEILKEADEPIGKDNDAYIMKTLLQTDLIIAAWGNNGSYLKRDQEVRNLLMQYQLQAKCLAITKEKQPKHVLYVANTTIPFDMK